MLYRNNGNGTFSDITAKAGVAGGASEWTSSVGFFDFDRDGRLDLYVANYLDVAYTDNPYCGFKRPGFRTYCSPTIFDGVADRLFRNNGNGTFTDVSQKAGIANPAGKGLGVTFCDVDSDGLVDIYVANDLVRNFLYRNNGNGTFRDIAYAAGVGFGGNGKPQAGMGTDCGDVDGNGLPDLFVTNFSEELNTLYLNRGKGLFEDATVRMGLQSGYPAARLRHEALRPGQRRRPRHPRRQRPHHRQHRGVRHGHDLRDEGPAVREHRRALRRRLGAQRAGAAGRPRRPRTGRGRLRQRRPSRHRHLEPGPTRRCC